MITAAEAAKLAENVLLPVKEILQRIELAAKNGENELIVEDYGFSPTLLYITEENFPKECKIILQKLRSLGYTAVVHSEEPQAELFLHISW